MTERVYWVAIQLSRFHGSDHEQYVRENVLPACRVAFEDQSINTEVPLRFEAYHTGDTWTMTPEQKVALFDAIDTGFEYLGVQWEDRVEVSSLA
jgi:hypothetical protein